MNIFSVPSDRFAVPIEIDLPGAQTAAGFLPDGRLLYRGTTGSARSFQPSARALDLATGQSDSLFDGAVAPEVHPSGRWIAYTALIDGRGDIYVRPFPDVDRHVIQVSSGGASLPTWSSDGRELYFLDRSRSPQGVVRVSVSEHDGGLAIGDAEFLFALDVPAGGRRVYEPLPDGRFFVFPRVAARPELIYVRNWIAELERLIPE